MDALSLNQAQFNHVALNHVPQAQFVLHYEKTNITHDITPHLLSLRYTDYLSGQADDVDIELEDAAGKWREAWYPAHGDRLSLAMGWQGQDLRELGWFEIDEVELSYPPATVSIRALATGIRSDLRTVQHHAYENMTLSQVAEQIAQRQGLELVGTVAPLALDRLTQQDSDLVFLQELASQYDYAFKIKSGKLVFYAMSELAKSAPVERLPLNALVNVRMREQLRDVPQAVEVKHQDPAQKQLVAYQMENGEAVALPSSKSEQKTSGETAKQTTRAASGDAAAALAQAKVAQANRARCRASFNCLGSPRLLSGNVIELVSGSPQGNISTQTPIGQFGGKYLIVRATHSVDRNGGYITELEASRVDKTPAPASQKATQARNKPQKAQGLVVYEMQNGQAVGTVQKTRTRI